MNYFLGAIAGLVFGCIVGVLKDLFIWRRYRESSPNDSENPVADHSLYIRMMASYFVNIITLVVAFLVRNIAPFDGIVFLIATGISLSIANHIGALNCKKKAQG